MAFHLCVEELPAFENTSACDVFSHFQHMPWAMLLDTCSNTLSDGRFDIIVHSPITKITLSSGEQQKQQTQQYQSNFIVDISADWQNVLSYDDKANDNTAFDVIATLHEQFCAQINAQSADDKRFAHLPFLCGALGYFSYDLNLHLHPKHINDHEPYQYDTPDIGVGIYDQSLIFDNKTGKVYCCYLDEQRADLLKNTQHTMELVPNEDAKAFKLTEKWRANLSPEEYTSRLKAVDDYIHAGDCYQINFAQRFKASYEGSEWEAYKRLREVNKAPFSSFIRLENSSILSVSPERFLQVKGKQVETKPIKGTRKRDKDPERDSALSEELLGSEKDKAENLMIVDLLRNDLSKHCEPHSVTVPQLFALESYPAVHHMVSTVLGTLKQRVSPLLLLKGAFPGGSITGAPKLRAMQIIAELEPDKRSIYCGSIGYIGVKNDMDTNICIRTVLAENNHLYCWAGGGIVLDSDIDSEYQESLDKVARILPILEETLGRSS